MFPYEIAYFSPPFRATYFSAPPCHLPPIFHGGHELLIVEGLHLGGGREEGLARQRPWEKGILFRDFHG